ncbi:hypothetical protein [Ornithinimicrobium faecis]|uniref:hypothetical protein n=1 Tax=Ornithinimicrobium faecis TaxID=2934158 RepID=UPI002119110B|nr:hypothetical protein [Ornithinimicrobium sp. HY1745]
MTDSPQVPAQEPTAREKATARNKKQAWLYIVIGVVLGVVAVLGLVSDDRGALDWALLVLAIINLGIGVMAVRRPEPRIVEPNDR